MSQEVETNWFVLSGPAEFGTRLLGDAISREGIHVVANAHPISESYDVKARMALGRTTPYRAEIQLLQEQLRLENGAYIPYQSLVVFNGGMGDYLAALDLVPKTATQVRQEDNQLTEQAIMHASTVRYRQIFTLPRPIEGLVFSGNSSLAAGIHRRQAEFYKVLDYKPTEIGDISSLEKAMRFVMGEINARTRAL